MKSTALQYVGKSRADIAMKRYIFLLAVVPAFLLLGNWMSAQQVNPQPLRITGAVVVREFLPGGADPQKAESETEFLTTDPIAGVVFAYTGGQRGDKVRVEWRNPFGALVQE